MQVFFFFYKFQNDEVKHIRMSTYLSGVLYTIEDTMKFVLKDHKCSGAIHSFCLFEKTKKEVINKTYNCCTGKDYIEAFLIILHLHLINTLHNGRNQSESSAIFL